MLTFGFSYKQRAPLFYGSYSDFVVEQCYAISLGENCAAYVAATVNAGKLHF